MTHRAGRRGCGYRLGPSADLAKESADVIMFPPRTFSRFPACLNCRSRNSAHRSATNLVLGIFRLTTRRGLIVPLMVSATVSRAAAMISHPVTTTTYKQR